MTRSKNLRNSMAKVLLDLESLILEYKKYVTRIRQRNPNVGDEKELTKHHEIHFNAILDTETRGFTDNEGRNNFFDALEKEISKVWYTSSNYNSKEEILSTIMMRLSACRTKLTGG